MARAMKDIEAEMWEQVRFFEEHDKLLEAQRIRQRTQYDLEMIRIADAVDGVRQGLTFLCCEELRVVHDDPAVFAQRAGKKEGQAAHKRRQHAQLFHHYTPPI